MLHLKRIILIGVFSITCGSVFAQDDDFCNALNTIAQDAPNKFRNIRGKVTQDNGTATTWACGIKVPGTINSRFVSSMGLFYEGAVFQTKNKDELTAIYEKFEKQLNACLAPQGYNMSMVPNFSTGMDGFKKVVFVKEPKEDMKPENLPAHITMEALYSKESALYTVVIYIFEH